MKITQLEHDIQELEDKLKEKGLSFQEKQRLQELQEEWYRQESARYGQCINCCL